MSTGTPSSIPIPGDVRVPAERGVELGVGASTYAGSTTYTAWGAVDLLKLGPAASPILQVDYSYYAWGGAGGEGRGRLLQIAAGTPSDATSLQDLRYTDYDLVGNVKEIQDWKARNLYGPQTLSFGYDDLDRLVSAQAANGDGNGTYAETYAYNAIGNLTNKAGIGYTYPASGADSVHPHGVRRVNGSGGSTKAVTVRAKGAAYANGWPQMKLYVNGTFRCQWTVSSSSYLNYSCNTALSGNEIVEVVYTNDVGSRALYVDYVVVDGLTVQAEGGAAVVDWGSGDAAFDGLNVVVGQELLDQNGALQLVKGAKAMALGYDANGNMTSRVVEGLGYVLSYDAEDRLTGVTKSGASIATFVYGPGGERVKGVVNGVTTVYIGNHYEKQGTTVRKYYYAGSQRVAMQENGVLYWLLVDHLGSMAVVVNALGAKVGEVRYKAWGEDRYTYGTIPTTYRCMGQRWEAGIGLCMGAAALRPNARWYDPALGRFVQPDTIVPEPGDPQSLNRFAYVRNNPLRYIDPSGHREEKGWTKEEKTKKKSDYAISPPVIDTRTYQFPRDVEYGEREGAPVLGVVWHMTQGETVAGALSAFRGNGTSANYIIDRNGAIYQVIPDEYAAWHAGGTETQPSRWSTSKYGENVTLSGIDVNRHTIGVEVVGYTPGHAPPGYEGIEGYTVAQKRAATALARWLAYAYDLDSSAMIGHTDVCPPPAKFDGGEYLPMIRMAVEPPVPISVPGCGGVFE